jgi:hypothetical protein
MTALLELPCELITSILATLDVGSILNCSGVIMVIAAGLVSLLMRKQTCKLLNNIAKTQEIQYILELSRSGLSHRRNLGLSASDALKLLRSYNERWNNLTPLATYSISLLEPSYAYELVDGIFAKAMPIHATWDIHSPSRTLTFYTLPTAKGNGKWAKKTIDDLGYNIKDFAIDPAQDLLVLLEPECVSGCASYLHSPTNTYYV